MKKIVLAVGLTILYGGNAIYAQETQEMKMRECIDYALAHHASSQIYTNNVEIAKKQNSEGLSYYMPQVNVSASFDDNIKRQTTILPAGAFSPTPLEIQFGNQFATTVIGQVDQVIYDQTLINSIKASRMNVELADLKVEKNESDIIYNTALAYYNVLILQEQLKLVGENETRIGQLMEVQKLQKEQGVLRETDYNRIVVNYNNITSQKELIEMNLEMAKSNLKNIMGMEAENEIKLTDSIDFDTDVPKPSIDAVDVSQKVDYRILEKSIELQQVDLKSKRAQVLPSVSAYARYGANAYSNDFETAFDDWFDFSAIGLKVNVPLFSGLRRYSQIKQSELQLDNAQQNLQLNANALSLQLENSQTKLSSSYVNLKMTKSNMELANEVFDMTNQQYQQGVVGMTDFLNADYATKEAQANYINSLLNYFIARIEIEQSKGTLKEFVNNL